MAGISAQCRFSARTGKHLESAQVPGQTQNVMR